MPGQQGARPAGERLVLRTAIGRYPHTAAIRDGAVASELVAFDFVDVPTIHQAFAPMVREQRFDVSEIAIATFLQAKAYRKPLVLLPVVLAARFQQSALLCRSDGDIRSPGDLVGRRVGVRAYSQTTGVWLRGILADEHGIRPEAVRWVTFEDAHVAEYRDPPLLPNGRRPAATSWPCFATASSMRSSSGMTCRTTRRYGRCSPILRHPPRRSGASTASCRSIISWRSGASWRGAGRI